MPVRSPVNRFPVFLPAPINLPRTAVVLSTTKGAPMPKGAPMLWGRRFDGLDTLVAERGSALLASAVLLTGSRAAGEDLLQAALERLMRSWGRVREDRERYLRRIMYHLVIDQSRRRRRRPEVFIGY